MKTTWLIGCALGAVATVAGAQTKAQQTVKPPIAQAWIDVATGAGMGGGMGGMGGGMAGGPGAPTSMGGGLSGALGAMLGGGSRGGAADNDFGRTASPHTGRWVDVTLYTSRNPNLAEANQAVPAATQLAPSWRLQAPPQAKPAPAPREDEEVAPQFERPKGKFILYWGCSETVRAGQPRVIDLATASPQEIAQYFQARRATQRGSHLAAGRPVWPSRDDRRSLPDGASIVGEHAYSGQGVPEGFRFNITAAQDLMPAIDLAQRDGGSATLLSWQALPTARAQFLAALGSKGEGETVFWTSSEVPETGFGLLDYQTNAAVDRWLKERVLLAPTVTQCAVPKGIFGEVGFLRMIAYGSELNLVHPPRPADPKVTWEPEWAVKVRVKSVTSAMLGVDMPGSMSGSAAPGSAAAAPPEEKKEERKPSAFDILRGVIGR